MRALSGPIERALKRLIGRIMKIRAGAKFQSASETRWSVVLLILTYCIFALGGTHKGEQRADRKSAAVLRFPLLLSALPLLFAFLAMALSGNLVSLNTNSQWGPTVNEIFSDVKERCVAA